MTASIEDLLEKLHKVKQSGQGWTALCPAHPDSTPSLTVGKGAGGKVLVNCHRGCTTNEIVAAVGMSIQDLFPDRIEKHTATEALYDYTDKDGNLVFQVVRRRTADGNKDFRQRKPDGAGGWVWTITDLKDKPLYRLPEVLEAVMAGNPVWVVEGEKDADALYERGIVATCNSGGAGKWRQNHTDTLKAAKVIISPDLDGPGFRHAQFVRDELEGVAASVRVVAPPEGNDVFAALEKGHSPVDFKNFDVDAALEEHDPFRLILRELREVGRQSHLELKQKVARARAKLDQLDRDETTDQFGRLVKWDTFLAEPIEEYDWVIPGLLERSERVIVVAAEGVGKRLDLGTMIPTPTGWTTMGGLKVGDIVFDRHGQPCNVTYVSPVERNPDAHRVWFSDGNYLDADAEHQWYTETLNEREKRRPGAVRTTAEIRETLISGRSSRALNHAIPTTAPLELPEADLPIDPYTLGAWLGDGTSCDGAICTEDPEVLANLDYETRWRPSTKNVYGVLGLKADLRSAELLDNKHIPPTYLRSSFKQRLALLQGLMDTDGTAGRRGDCEFSITNEALARGVHELILTLGIKCTFREAEARLNGEYVSQRYRLHFKTDIPVFRLERKLHRLPKNLATPRSLYRYITSVEPIPPVPMRCIEVDSPDHTYLAGEAFIPTHNTMLARQVALMSSAGLSPFKRDSMPPIKTLFVDLENPERIIRRTSRQIADTIKVVQQLNRLQVPAHLLVKPDGINLLEAKDRNDLEQVIALVEPDLLFLGPLYKSYIDPGGQTSEAVAVTVARFLDYIRDAYGCALWLEHHAPLGSSDTSRPLRPFGSSVWSRWSEFGIALAPDPVAPGVFDVRHYRGMRDEREWPKRLRKGGEFPFTAEF